MALFAGELAALKVYDRTLTEAEIEQAFKKLAVEMTNALVPLWMAAFVLTVAMQFALLRRNEIKALASLNIPIVATILVCGIPPLMT